MLERIRSRIAVLLRRNRLDRELDEEMSLHIDLLARDLTAQGMDPSEARRQARLRFGSVERAKARVREERGLGLLDEIARNLRFALRTLWRSPVFSVTAVLTLGLCIGLGAAVFTMVNAVLWRPLPFPDPDRLARVLVYKPQFGKTPGNTAVDGEMWQRVRDEASALQPAVYSDQVAGVNLSTDEAAVFVQQQRVGAGYFRTLGVAPLLGREFRPEEDVPGGDQVALLSHRLWTGTFRGDPGIVGTTVRLKGDVFTVVGVMPPEFRSPGDAEIWTPLRASINGEGGGTNFEALVRLPAGMTMAAADARLASIQPGERMARNFSGQRFGLVPLSESLTIERRMPMLVLLGAVVLLLMVGCANVAGLQTARALSRSPEMATRRALGGGAGALARQVLTESVLLGALGGVAGLGLAWLAVSRLGALAHSQFGLWQEIRVDGAALVAVLALTAAATVVCALAPVFQAGRAPTREVLIGGARGTVGGGRHALRKSLLIGQVAMVTALLFGAGLLLRSYGHLRQLAPGFVPDGLLTVQYSLDDARYAEAERVGQLFDQTLEEIRRLPGVSAAAVALSLPYERPLNMGYRLPSEDEKAFHLVNVVYVTPDLFQTLGVPLREGRLITDGDRVGAPTVAVVSEALTARDFNTGSALGAHLTMDFGPDKDVTLVGVVGNVQQAAGFGDDDAPVSETPTIYVPVAQATSGFLRGMHVWYSPSWIIRSGAEPPDLARRVTEIFRRVDPDLPVARVISVRSVMDRAFAVPRFEAVFLIVVAAFALALAGVGLYGLIAHQVLQRRSEMGLRMALGATPAGAVWTAAAEGMRLTLIGLVLGAGLCVALAKVMTGLIWGITPYDPVALAGLLVAVLSLAVVASVVPAARVGRLDPARILREG